MKWSRLFDYGRVEATENNELIKKREKSNSMDNYLRCINPEIYKFRYG